MSMAIISSTLKNQKLIGHENTNEFLMFSVLEAPFWLCRYQIQS